MAERAARHRSRRDARRALAGARRRGRASRGCCRAAPGAGARAATTWPSTSRATSAATRCSRSPARAVRVGFAMAGGGPLLPTSSSTPGAHTATTPPRLVDAAFRRGSSRAPARRSGSPCPTTRARRAARAAPAPHGRYIVVHASGGARSSNGTSTASPRRRRRIARAQDADDGAQRRAGRRRRSSRRCGPRCRPTCAVVDLDGRRRSADARGRPRRRAPGRHRRYRPHAPGGGGAARRWSPCSARRMPARYAPRSTAHRVVRVDLPCAPCNQIRKPPARCRGHTPDCLVGVTVER